MLSRPLRDKMRAPKAASVICSTLTWGRVGGVEPWLVGETMHKSLWPTACPQHQPEPLCLPAAEISLTPHGSLTHVSYNLPDACGRRQVRYKLQKFNVASAPNPAL